MKNTEWKDIITKPLAQYTDIELAGMIQLAESEIKELGSFLRLVKKDQQRRFFKEQFKK